MKRILAVAALSLSLAGCVYGGPPAYYGYGYHGGYGYYGGWGAGSMVPSGEAAASPG
jgi:hypothetical protein